MANYLKRPQGTEDVTPERIHKWMTVEKVTRDIAESFGFSEIRIPTFEVTELFQRSVGETTDVVQKEMYSVIARETQFTLRPEGTAGTIRAMLQNGMLADALPQKVFYQLSCFRHERPQAGRLREFHQFGVELAGPASPYADAEIILLAKTVLDRVGLKDVVLNLNSIGCPKCRAQYRKALQDFIRPNLDKLCETSQGRFETNPMRILDSKDPEDQKYLVGAPMITDYLCDECRDAFAELQEDLDILGIEYEVDPGIVRGLDYYTKTAFEFVSTDLGAQSTVCGGGRYDHLVEEVGGPYTPGVGFGMGLERLLLILEAKGIEIPKPADCDVFIATLGERAKKEGLKLADALRRKGHKVLTDVMGRGLKAQLKYADRSGASYTVVIGEDELDKGVVTLRDMVNSSQKEIRIESLEEEINK